MICLYSSSDKTVKVWDTITKQCEHTFKDHSDQVYYYSVWCIQLNSE